MKKITCNTGRKYEILVGENLIDKSGSYIREVTDAKRAVIVSDSNVAPLYTDKVTASLQSADFEVATACFEAGEQSKNLQTVSELYNVFSDAGITRSDIIIGLGGGVTGDIAGFAAATWLRGVEFVQIPTSLLAQVDSSIGGKTGVDLPGGKNLVGAFWQPSLVICDIGALETLPSKYFSDGMAEVIKYGCILSEELFEKLENNKIEDILTDVIYDCVTLKAKVVEEDERESGARMILNFGHTIGHALEKLQGYTGFSHGEAVAIGMLYVAKPGEIKGLTEPDTYGRLENVLRRYYLPVYQTDFSKKELCIAAGNDKKSTADSINIVLLKKIGEAFIKNMEIEEFESFINL